MTGDIGKHNDEGEMEQHGDAKKPGDNHDPVAFGKWFVRGGVDIGRTVGSYDAHSDAQAQGREDGRALHFSQQQRMTAFAERPGPARFRNAQRLYERRSVEPGAPRADGTANRASFLFLP